MPELTDGQLAFLQTLPLRAPYEGAALEASREEALATFTERGL